MAAWPYNHGGMSAARDDEDDDDAYNNDEEDDDEEENDNDDDDDDEDDSDAADFAGRKRRPGHRKQNNLIKKQKAKASLEPTLRSVSNAKKPGNLSIYRQHRGLVDGGRSPERKCVVDERAAGPLDGVLVHRRVRAHQT